MLDEAQIEASFCAAVRIAKEQKSISLQKRAEATYAEYHAKKQAGQEDTDSDYLFGDCSQRAVSRFGCGKSSVIKQTREMQSEDTSARRDSLKEGVLSQGCLGELVIKGPARLTALAKPCSLLGRDSGFIGLGWKRQRRASIASIGIL